MEESRRCNVGIVNTAQIYLLVHFPCPDLINSDCNECKTSIKPCPTHFMFYVWTQSYGVSLCYDVSLPYGVSPCYVLWCYPVLFCKPVLSRVMVLAVARVKSVSYTHLRAHET